MAIPKLINEPISKYSVLASVLLSLSRKRKIDFAAIINPTALYCPKIIKNKVKNRSKFPIMRPAFSNDSSFLLFFVLEISYNSKTFFINTLEGLMQKMNEKIINNPFVESRKEIIFSENNGEKVLFIEFIKESLIELLFANKTTTIIITIMCNDWSIKNRYLFNCFFLIR